MIFALFFQSETVFNDIVVDASTMDQDKQAVDSKTEYNIKLLCMGYSHFIRAKISFGYGVFQEAVESCGNALKYLNKASKSSLNTKPITPAHRIFSNLQMELIKV